MSRQIITVTLNPSIDVTLWTDGFHADRTNRVLSEKKEAGGKGINVSRVVDSFGLSNTCLAVAGEDNRREFADFLKADGLRFELLQVPGAVRENLTLRTGNQTMKLNRKGPALSRMMTGALMALIRQWVKPGDIAVFAGSLPEGFHIQDYVELVLATKQAGALIALDCEAIRPEHLRIIRPWLIKPNIHELHDMLGFDSERLEDILDAARRLQAAGVENTLVSLGQEGIVCVGPNETVRVPVPRVEVKSTVGSGDSALAGFVVGFVQGKSLADCTRLAAACGTACAMQDATSLATRATAMSLYPQMEVH